jgi:hypothetical protein
MVSTISQLEVYGIGFATLLRFRVFNLIIDEEIAMVVLELIYTYSQTT